MYFPSRGRHLQRRVGWVRAVDDISFTVHRGETLGPGRRIRLRQEHHRPRHPAALQADRAARSRSTGTELTTARRRRAAPDAPRHADDLPGPVREPEPAHDGRHRSSASRWRSTTSATAQGAPASASHELLERRRPESVLSPTAIRTSSPAASASASGSPAPWRSNPSSSSATSRSRPSTCRSRRRSSTCSRSCRSSSG